MLEQLREEQIQHGELLGGSYDMLSVCEWRTGFDAWEEIWMITDLLKLHEHIQKFDLVGTLRVNYVYVARKYLLVELLLNRGHANVEIYLLLWGETCLYIAFESS